jgi:hypothetical protein
MARRGQANRVRSGAAATSRGTAQRRNGRRSQSRHRQTQSADGRTAAVNTTVGPKPARKDRRRQNSPQTAARKSATRNRLTQIGNPQNRNPQDGDRENRGAHDGAPSTRRDALVLAGHRHSAAGRRRATSAKTSAGVHAGRARNANGAIRARLQRAALQSRRSQRTRPSDIRRPARPARRSDRRAAAPARCGRR